MRALRSVLIALTFCLIAADLANAAPFANGSFEDGAVGDAGCTTDTLGAGSADIPAWTVTDGSVDWLDYGPPGDPNCGPAFEAFDGDRVLDMNGGQPGALEQTFDTTSGTRYVVTFRLAHNPGCDAAPGLLRASAAGTSALFRSDGGDSGPFHLLGFGFTATSTSSTLEFRSLIGGCSGPVLDDVDVIDCANPPAGVIVDGGPLDADGNPNSIGGTGGDDVICGDENGNSIDGAGGDDVIVGLGGGDFLLGGPGDDAVDGGAGDDVMGGAEGFDGLDGGPGADQITGDTGNDSINGGPGDDGLLQGGPGSDLVHGGDGSDGQLFGNDEDDLLFGGITDAGTDRMFGGYGSDQFDVVYGQVITDPGIDRADYLNDLDDPSARSVGVFVAIDNGGGDGDAGSLAATDGQDGDNVGEPVESVSGSVGPDNINSPLNFNNTFSGGPGADQLSPGDGADFMAGGTGSDQINGGNGSDRVTYRNAGVDYNTAGGVSVTLDDVDNDGVDVGGGLGSEADNVHSDIEYVFGSNGPDVLDLSGYTGNETANPPATAGVVVVGFDGDDVLTATDGNDYLDGGAGNDTLNCGPGTDIFVNGEIFDQCP